MTSEELQIRGMISTLDADQQAVVFGYEKKIKDMLEEGGELGTLGFCLVAVIVAGKQ